MKKVISLLLCLLIVLSFVVSAAAIGAVEIKGIKLDKTSVDLDVGGTYTLAWTLNPTNTTQKTLSFKTSDANVATVDSNGKIAAKGAGTATITVSSTAKTSVSSTCKVTVTKPAPQTLTVETYDRGTAGNTPADNNYWTQWIQKNFGDPNNVTVKFVTAPRWETPNDSKLTLWMASNSAPDICVTYTGNLIDKFYTDGGVADLTSSLAKYGPVLKQFLGADVLSQGVKDGKQYRIPAKRLIDAMTDTWIRADWLSKLKLPLPTTVDEWYNDMKAFKTQNPDKLDKVVPFVITNDVGWTAKNFFESFYTDNSDKMHFLTNDRYTKLLAPGEKEGVRLLNKMFNEGLISPEFALDTQSSAYNADVINGKAGCLINNFDYTLRTDYALMTGLRKTNPKADLIPINPFKNKTDGQYREERYSAVGIYSFVPKTSQNKADLAIKYLNWMADPDVMFFLQYGEKGVNHTVNSDGIPVNTPVKGDKIQNSSMNIDLTLILNGFYGKDKSDVIKRNSLAYKGDQQQIFINSVNIATKNSYTIIRPEATIAADAKYLTAVATKANEVFAKCITCKPDQFDATWTAQIAGLNRAGASQIINERKVAWEKQFGKK